MPSRKKLVETMADWELAVVGEQSYKIEVYHLGASLEDLAKKVFAFSKIDVNSFELLGK